MTLECLPLPPNMILLCRPWLPKNGETRMQGHCSMYIYCVRATRVKLQEIPQLIIIYGIQLQPTSRRFLRELDEALRGNNLQYIYILQCPCILVSLFFGNQGLYNKIMLGGNGRHSKVMCKGSSYTHLSHTMTLLPLPSLVAWLTINTTVLPRTPVLLSCQTAVQAIKVIFFTIITRITSSRDEFSPLDVSI